MLSCRRVTIVPEADWTPIQDAFDLYHQVHSSPSTRLPLNGPALPALGHGIAGSIGAAISNLATYPLALIITRLQVQKQFHEGSEQGPDEYSSIRDAALRIYSTEGGMGGLYAGVIPDTCKTIADSFLFFLLYDFLRQSRIREQEASQSHLPVLDELGIGFLSGAFAKLLTTPIANIVTRKQASYMRSVNSTEDANNDSIGSIASHIRSEKGLQGFWSGYSASLVLTFNPSLTFFFYETLKRLLLSHSQRSQPSVHFTFLLAAISKALASTITYPFSLAKSRAQASATSSGVDDIDKKGSAKEGLNISDIRSNGSKNVFGLISQIARLEGVAALYQGVDGEVLKGFFSHGLTMIMKDAVHSVVIQLYYVILKLSKRFPSPEGLTHIAKNRIRSIG